MAASDETLRADDLAALKEDVGDAYAGRTVLVTGADGFMGSHVTEALVRLGARVHVFVRATSSGALHNIGHLRQDVSVHWGDLTDRLAVDRAVKALAASRPIRPSSSTSAPRPMSGSPGCAPTRR